MRLLVGSPLPRDSSHAQSATTVEQLLTAAEPWATL